VFLGCKGTRYAGMGCRTALLGSGVQEICVAPRWGAGVLHLRLRLSIEYSFEYSRA
jgi:hypothetical protein